MRNRFFLYLILCCCVLLSTYLMFTFDVFYGCKLKRAKIKYGIEIRPKDVKLIDDSYDARATRCRFEIAYEDGRRLSCVEERYHESGCKREDVAIMMHYGWNCDSIDSPVELRATYVLENKLSCFVLKDTVFTKTHMNYDKKISYEEFLKMKSSWEGQ